MEMEHEHFNSAKDLLRYLDAGRKISNPTAEEQKMISWCESKGYVETVRCRANANGITIGQKLDSPVITARGKLYLQGLG